MSPRLAVGSRFPLPSRHRRGWCARPCYPGKAGSDSRPDKSSELAWCRTGSGGSPSPSDISWRSRSRWRPRLAVKVQVGDAVLLGHGVDRAVLLDAQSIRGFQQHQGNALAPLAERTEGPQESTVPALVQRNTVPCWRGPEAGRCPRPLVHQRDWPRICDGGGVLEGG